MHAVAQLDWLALVIHIAGAAVFAGVFWFLHRESRISYFGYWAVAWAILGAALLFNLASVLTGRRVFLAPFALLELAFAAAVLFAAASVFGRLALKVSSTTLLVPAVALTALALGLVSNFTGFYALLSVLLTAAYGWNFFAFLRRQPRGGMGHKLFSASLLASSLFYSHYALLYGSLYLNPAAETPAYLRFHDLYDLGLETLLAFSAMMMWMETQHQELVKANEDLARSRAELARNAQLDALTGLLNRSALNETCAANEPVSGVVAVIDLDNFKDVNDALGHVTGDEVLANVGGLIKASVRKQDMAWRWGGDEFALLFLDQSRETVEERLQALAERLLRFQLRGKGLLPVHMSWGSAELIAGSLQEGLDEADRQMYQHKRVKLGARAAAAAGPG